MAITMETKEPPQFILKAYYPSTSLHSGRDRDNKPLLSSKRLNDRPAAFSMLLLRAHLVVQLCRGKYEHARKILRVNRGQLMLFREFD